MRKLVCAVVGGLALVAAGPVVAAEKFPSRPMIRLIVSFSPGGNVDVFARVLYREVTKELGTSETVPGFVFNSGRHEIFASKGTPAPIVKQLQEAIHKALQVPHVHKHFTDNGYEPDGDPPNVWAKKFRADMQRIAEAAKAAEIQPN